MISASFMQATAGVLFSDVTTLAGPRSSYPHPWPPHEDYYTLVKVRKRSKSGRPRFCCLSADVHVKYACSDFGIENSGSLPLYSSLMANPAGEVAVSSEQKVYDVVLKQAALVKKQLGSSGSLEVKPDMSVPGTPALLAEAYDRCGDVCAEYAKTFYLGI